MSPGLISRVVVADKIAAIHRMLDGIRSLPLDDLATFTADPRAASFQGPRDSDGLSFTSPARAASALHAS